MKRLCWTAFSLFLLIFIYYPFILPAVHPLASSIHILRLSWCALPLNHSLLHHPPIRETRHTAVLLRSAALHLSYHSHQFMFSCWYTFICPFKTLFYLLTSLFLFTVSSGESVRIPQKLYFISWMLYYRKIKIKGRFMAKYKNLKGNIWNIWEVSFQTVNKQHQFCCWGSINQFVIGQMSQEKNLYRVYIKRGPLEESD